MFNVGMTEIFCFAVIALVILGPEQLPEAVRFIAKWYGKFKRAITTIQQEIDQELKLSEFREEIQREIQRLSELEQRLQQQLDKQHLFGETSCREPQSRQTRPHAALYRYTAKRHIPPFLKPCAGSMIACPPDNISPHFKIAV